MRNTKPKFSSIRDVPDFADADDLATEATARAAADAVNAAAVTTEQTARIAGDAALSSAIAGKASLGHTHTSGDVTDFAEAARDFIGAALVAGSNVTITVNDGADTITIAAAAGSPGGSSGQVQYNNAGSFGGFAGLTVSSSSPNILGTAQGTTHVAMRAKGAVSHGSTTAIFDVVNSSDRQQFVVMPDSSGAARVAIGNATEFPELHFRDPGFGGGALGTDKIAVSYGQMIFTTGSLGHCKFSASGVTGTIQLGIQDAVYTNQIGGPGNVYLRVGKHFGGTNVASSKALYLQGPQGTGTGDCGPIEMQTAPAGSTGSSFNALVTALKVDGSKVSGETRMLLWDVDKGALSRVTVGAADSGGTGYKLLRVPN